MVCLQGYGPAVSVVMPVHDDARYIRQAIGSILAQTFSDFELLIIDDGSTDETPAIVHAAAAADSRVTVVTQEQMGVPKSINKGIALARGAYLARHDGDDFSTPERFARQVDFLERHPQFGLVGSFVRRLFPDGTLAQELVPPVDDEDIRRQALDRECFAHGALMFRRAALEAVGGYRVELPLGDDADLFLRMLERFKVANLPEFLYYQHGHHDSVVGSSPRLVQYYMRIVGELALQRREEGRDILMLGASLSSEL